MGTTRRIAKVSQDHRLPSSFKKQNKSSDCLLSKGSRCPKFSWPLAEMVLMPSNSVSLLATKFNKL